MNQSRMKALWGVGAALLVAGCAVTALVGCSNGSASSSRPSASSLSEGVNLLDVSDPAWGFNAAYLKAGHVVYIESRTGALKPDVYRQDSPDEPANEMDLRFVDESNRTFFAQRGGDSWVDPSWSAEIAKSTDPHSRPASPAELEANWALAHEAASALTKVLPATFADHVYHLGTFAQIPSPGDDPVSVEQLKSSPAVNQEAYGSYGSSSWTQLYYAKYSKPAGCVLWVCGGSHSGVAQYINPNAGAWTMNINACNHGTCPIGGGGWKHACSGGGAAFGGGVSITGSTVGGGTGSNDGQGGCQTGYSWSAGGNNHLCNDDAAYEMWQVDNGNQGAGPYGFTYTGSGFCEGSLCKGGNPAYYGCAEGNNNNGYGSWNTPNCF